MGNNTNVDLGSEPPSYSCDTCSKSYPRRDRLNRHRRRCQGPAKPLTRRKACDACVRSKTKCCYGQPHCLRCLERGLECRYASASASASALPTASGSFSASADANTGSGNELSFDAQAVNQSMSDIFTTQDAFSLTTPIDNWPLDAFDIAMSAFPYPPGETTATAVASQSTTLYTQEDPTFDPIGAALTQSSVTGIASPPTSHQSSSAMPHSIYPLSFQQAPLSPISSPSAEGSPTVVLPPSPTALSPTLSYSDTIVQTLGEYPAMLLQDDFASPLLHWSLYSDHVPDIAMLPLTSMAICCGRGLVFDDSIRFMRRVMDSERQRLIEAYPDYRCMQQWDALHAMLLYEILELRCRSQGDGDSWKQRPRVKGLKSPFLLKMAQYYASSYREIRNSHYGAFEDPGSVTSQDSTSAWARWRITETARRTLFMINIVNWYSNYDLAAGKQQPYYEPLDNDLILSMPLPCSHKAWTARTEDEWKAAMQAQQSQQFENGTEHNFVHPGLTLRHTLLAVSRVTFSDSIRDFFQGHWSKSKSFLTSEQLCNFYVLCATQQFNSTE